MNDKLEIIKKFYKEDIISFKKISEVYEDKYGKWIGICEIKYYDFYYNICYDKWYVNEENKSLFLSIGPEDFTEHYKIINNELEIIGINGLLYELGKYEEVMCIFEKFENNIFYLKIILVNKIIKIPIKMLKDKTLEKMIKLGDLFSRNEIENLLK